MLGVFFIVMSNPKGASVRLLNGTLIKAIEFSLSVSDHIQTAFAHLQSAKKTTVNCESWQEKKKKAPDPLIVARCCRVSDAPLKDDRSSVLERAVM